MSILSFIRKKKPTSDMAPLVKFIDGYSLEVMPRTLAKVADLTDLFPKGTRVYIAHIEGTKIADMVETAKRLGAHGLDVMPHFPARLIPDQATFSDWLRMYREEADVTQALLLGGGNRSPVGSFDNSMQLIETGELDKLGFTNIHFAGHPEGNRDIDPKGGSTIANQALSWKHALAQRSDAEMALITQFIFDAVPLIKWSKDIAEAGVDLPIHVGLAGPAKLQTLIKLAISCGIGPSLKVLQKRAADVTKLLIPYSPDLVALDLAKYCLDNPHSNITQAHLFPLGGIMQSVDWAKSAGRNPA